jgi:hypothetical protein
MHSVNAVAALLLLLLSHSPLLVFVAVAPMMPTVK